MIPGGYILQPRTFDGSDASKMPPVAREVFMYLVRNVNHSKTKDFDRGQGFFDIKSIMDDLCWYVGYRKETYSKTQVAKALRRLREDSTITTTKTTRGLIVTICNYDIYQNPKNYEDHSEETPKEPRRPRGDHTINKNDKNDKNENKPKKKTVRFTPPSLSEVKAYCLERKNKVDPETFIAHYTTNGWMRGKNKIKDWKACVVTWEKKQGGNNGGNRKGAGNGVGFTEAGRAGEKDWASGHLS